MGAGTQNRSLKSFAGGYATLLKMKLAQQKVFGWFRSPEMGLLDVRQAKKFLPSCSGGKEKNGG